MLVLTRKDLEDLLDMRTVLDAVERGLVEHARGSVKMPPRHVVPLGGGSTTYVMSAFLGGMGSLAVKVVSDIRGNVDRGLPNIVGSVLLLDSETGVPLCLLDGGYVTSMRTGATSALAARCLSLVDSQVAGIIGTGVQARTQVLGLWTVRDIQLVKAYSRSKENVRRFCEDMAEMLGIEAAIVDGAREVVEGSDIIVTATNSQTPVLRSEWLEPGLHINSIGGGTVKELDPEVYRRCTVVVDSREGALQEASDLKEAVSKGAFSAGEVYAELGELVAGMKQGRTDNKSITLFRSVGMALEDAATAAVAYRLAREAGVGRELTL